jgi:hypothetical protein
MSEYEISSREFSHRVTDARKRWENTISRISHDEIDTPGFCECHSLKEVLGHIAWYEREMIILLKTRTFAGSSYWDLPQDERNMLIFDEVRELSPEQVFDQSEQVFSELVQLVEVLTDEDLNDPASFSGMPQDWQPWQVIASNTYEHYDDHLQQAEAWLKRQR